MYKAVFKIQVDCIDEIGQKLFTPFINCYELHSVVIQVNGQSQEQDVDFNFSNEYTNWTGGFKIEQSDSIIFDLNYFYIKPDNVDVLSFLIDNTYTNQSLSKDIVSKHYIEGQFSFDNGLYKNAVLNFGTTLEGLLNKQLAHTTLNDLINEYTGTADKADMHFIRTLRNKVHPNQISNSQDITRMESIKARNNLERILNKI